MSEQQMNRTGITSVRHAVYVDAVTVLAEVQFDGKTDNNGEPVYLSVTVTDTPGNPDPRMLNDIREHCQPVVPDFVLSAAKRTKRHEINAWRDAQEDGNYLLEYNGHRWDYGKATQERMAISLAMAKRNALPAGFAWTDGDNNIVPMDNAGLIALSAAIEQAIFEKGMEINQRQLQMKAEVQALTTLDEVRNYRTDW